MPPSFCIQFPFCGRLEPLYGSCFRCKRGSVSPPICRCRALLLSVCPCARAKGVSSCALQSNFDHVLMGTGVSSSAFTSICACEQSCILSALNTLVACRWQVWGATAGNRGINWPRSSVRSFVHLSTLAPTIRCCLGQNERTRGLGHLRATVAFLHTTSSAAKEDSKSVQGLFGIKGLVSPEDFRRLAAEAEAEVESLLTVAI